MEIVILIKKVIYTSQNLRLEYNGPELNSISNVVIAFPPLDYPMNSNATGWGKNSFEKRNIAVVCVFHAAPHWYQYNDFFSAMSACKDFFPTGINICTYGYSMGGYGAFLSAQALDAYRAIAISPQYSIDPNIAPFERRFNGEWTQFQKYYHNINQHMDNHRQYFVLIDPFHKLDSKQEALFFRTKHYKRCLIHGAGHAAIQTLVQMNAQNVLFDLLSNQATLNDLRRVIRNGRHKSFRYVRKLGKKSYERKSKNAQRFLDLAIEHKFNRLIKKWQV